MSLKSPTPAWVTTQRSHETAVLTPVSHPSATLSTVATGCPLSRGPWDRNPHRTLSRSTATLRLQSGLLWSGEGEGSDLFLKLFCAASVIFTSELIHCLPQPRSQQGVDEEESFKQTQAMVGFVRIQRAPVKW